jgi:hypothetical protein
MEQSRPVIAEYMASGTLRCITGMAAAFRAQNAPSGAVYGAPQPASVSPSRSALHRIVAI